MSYASIDDLRSQLGGRDVTTDSAYVAKQLHDLPPNKSVDRVKFILDHCKGKRVLEFGASGQLSEAIREVAKEYWGVDRVASVGIVSFDLDEIDGLSWDLPGNEHETDIVVCGEVLEHLGNPLWFLTRLKRQYAGVPVIITVPNAYARNSQEWIKKGKENVNKDHVAWYSPKVLATLLERAGYTYGDLFYYNGKDATAEGLIVVTE